MTRVIETGSAYTFVVDTDTLIDTATEVRFS